MKNIHPSTSSCTYKCVTCQKEFVIETVGSTKEVPVEVCSNCHSFYIGKQST
ncbi:50S ribosomal protein L31, partial [Ureaplasma diversum]